MLRRFREHGVAPVWHTTVMAPDTGGAPLPTITSLNQHLANVVAQLACGSQPFGVVGGDHSCAIGTWNGVSRDLNGSPGLVWIDAHMDAHTPSSSRSGALHGMPLACLLGYGDPALAALEHRRPVLQPDNVCLVGVRSFEPEEQHLLQQLGVRTFFMADIARRGLESVMREALDLVTAQTAAYGISIDLDAVDPSDAPGVGTPARHGIRGPELIAVLDRLTRDKVPLCVEVAELNPANDQDQRTALLVCDLLAAVLGEKDTTT